MFGANRLIFALDPKRKLDAETLVLHSGPKFLCFVVHLYKYFLFWYQTENVSKKVYAVIWPVLEITSLKSSHELCSHAISDTVGLCFAYFCTGSVAYTIFGSNAGALVTTPKHKLDS